MGNDFEMTFREFVKSIGGEVLPESDAERADFLFRDCNVVAELKTLQEDARMEHARKLQALLTDWAARGLIRVYGRTTIELRKLNPVCQREWLDILQAPVEHLIRKANRQVRSTKQSVNLPKAKGLLLIANDGNLLHTSPIDYMILVSRVLQKTKPTGERRFPHIRGVVYLSYRIKSKDEGMPFWVPGQLDPTADADMREFQEKLRRGWFLYVANLTGHPVKEEFKRIEGV